MRDIYNEVAELLKKQKNEKTIRALEILTRGEIKEIPVYNDVFYFEYNYLSSDKGFNVGIDYLKKFIRKEMKLKHLYDF